MMLAIILWLSFVLLTLRWFWCASERRELGFDAREQSAHDCADLLGFDPFHASEVGQ